MMRLGALLASAIAIAIAVNIGCGFDPFRCESNTQCMQADSGGICQPTGYCSFPDPSCESGQRYGEHAGEGLAGQCVTPDDPGTSSGVAAASDTEEAPSSTDETSESGSTSSTSSSPDTSSEGTVDLDATETTGSEPLDPDLVAWYRFEDPLEGTAMDSTMNALHGTCTACPTSTTGVFGNAASFDGHTQFIDLPSSPLFDLDTALTLTAWVRVEESTGDVKSILARPFGRENRNSWEIFARYTNPQSTPRVFFRLGDTPTTWVGTELDIPSLGEWIHIAMAWDGMQATAYLDGQATSFAIMQVVYDAHAPRIGADVDWGEDDNFFTGAIDEVRIYSRALDADEIVDLATPP